MDIDYILKNKMFHFQKVVGEGPYGKVYEAISRKDGQKYAIKKVHCENDIKEVIKEIERMQECKSDTIVRYHDIFESINELWVVVEYQTGSLRDVLDLYDDDSGGVLLSESHIQLITKVVLTSLHFLHHERKSFHNCIKPSNILISEKGTIKLDFGISKLIAASIHPGESFVDKACYLAPEVITNEFENEDALKRDIWSLGITLIELAEGKAPFSDLHPLRQIFIIPQANPPRLNSNRQHNNNNPVLWSTDFVDFVNRCLVKDPKKRANTEQLLEHPFITSLSSVNNIEEEEEIIIVTPSTSSKNKKNKHLKRGGLSEIVDIMEEKKIQMRREMEFRREREVAAVVAEFGDIEDESEESEEDIHTSTSIKPRTSNTTKEKTRTKKNNEESSEEEDDSSAASESSSSSSASSEYESERNKSKFGTTGSKRVNRVTKHLRNKFGIKKSYPYFKKKKRRKESEEDESEEDESEEDESEEDETDKSSNSSISSNPKNIDFQSTFESIIKKSKLGIMNNNSSNIIEEQNTNNPQRLNLNNSSGMDERFLELVDKDDREVLDIRSFVVGFREKGIPLEVLKMAKQMKYLKKEMIRRIEILRSNYSTKEKALELWIKYVTKDVKEKLND